MYEDLVKSLRSCWRINDPSFNCVQMKNGACDPIGRCVPYLHDMAADAIEDLQDRIANIMVTVKSQKHIIKANNAADVRPVVLCKDCRHRDPEDHKCDSGQLERAGCVFPVDDDYFCAYGEKS